VSTAGDVNGDGFSDAVVGAYGYGNGDLAEGAAFTYHGSAAGLATTAAWTAESNQALAWFGEAVATAGDVNGDGFCDVIVGAPQYDNGEEDEGRAFLYYGNEGDGLDRIARQGRADNVRPIDLLGRSDSPTSFRLKALGRTAFGRGKVELQWEVKPLGTPFDGSGLGNGTLLDTGVPGVAGSAVALNELVTGLTADTAYHWRLRIVTNSPFFPHSPWLWLPYDGATETDLRTGATTAVADGGESSPARSLQLMGSTPNPFVTSTQVAYRLPHSGRHRLAVYDVLGREVALLVDGMETAGEHRTSWNGKNARGHDLPSGVYFLRLESKGQVEKQKLVMAR
jgi:hypothetical protein